MAKREEPVLAALLPFDDFDCLGSGNPASTEVLAPSIELADSFPRGTGFRIDDVIECSPREVGPRDESEGIVVLALELRFREAPEKHEGAAHGLPGRFRSRTGELRA
ncbi:hypothetical protein GCM10027449_23490 [Sinomonas notoginsengisoli]